jgi:thiol-disulfide isomerase/thioredoxin
MKRNLILTFLLFCFCPGKSQPPDSNSFILKGKIIGRDTGYIYLWYRGLDGVVSDSFHLNGGEFIFTGKLREPTGALLSSFCFVRNNKSKYESHVITELFIEPGHMNLVATMDSFQMAQLEGSRSDSDRVRLLRMKDPVMSKTRPVEKELDMLAPVYNAELAKDPQSGSFKRLKIKNDSIWSVLKPLYTELSQIDSAFITDNTNSFYAVSLFSRYVSGGSTDQFPDIKKLYDRFPSNIKESSYGKSIAYVMESEINIYIGAEAIDFIAINRQGDTIRLSDFKNMKYVLLDFWGTWCMPCLKIIPALYKINNRYRNKLEVISIAYRDKEADWDAVIRKDHMDWSQILDNDGPNKIFPSSGMITDSYYISEFPSLILIDRNHKIIQLFGGEGKNKSPIESLDKELEKILQ